MHPNFEEEKTLWKAGFTHIAGVDEAGRGPLAGPVVIGSVILPKNFDAKGITDSKKLSSQKREELFTHICNNALSYNITCVSPKMIDKHNIYEATRQGMQKSIKNLSINPDFVLLDAMNINLREIPQKNMIKGDLRVLTIAAASILAKVHRDRLMKEYAKKYPEYGFDKHMGYGTKYHVEALQKHGPCSIHRKTFAPVKEILS